MLVLTRRPEQEIIIGKDIAIKIVQVRGDHVKLGITAPANVSVHRKEIADRIKEMRGIDDN